MAKRGFLSERGIKRNAIKRDLLFFGLPAFVLFVLGLIFSAGAGWEGSLTTIWGLVRQPEKLATLSAQNIFGLAMIIGGFIVVFVSYGTLRMNYSSSLVIRDEHQLITHGIYRFARHPLYLGVIMVTMGVPVYVSSVFGLVIMAALIPVFLNRIRMEEGLLVEEFGDEYRAYQERTKKLIPFVY